MQGIKAVYRKELADHFSSFRFLILFALISLVSLTTAYMAGLNLSKDLAEVAKPRFVFLMLFTASGVRFSLVQFVAIFGPLLGLILGFDAINRERNEGTLSKLLSQPIYRDAVVNGKFLAGVTVVAIVLTAIVAVVSGLGLLLLGVVPGAEEVGRLLIYLLISVVYVALWLGVSILFSILFRSAATSALAALVVWIFFSFFVPLGANALANAAVASSAETDTAALVRRLQVERDLTLFSPMVLYQDATSTIADPMRRTNSAFIQVGMLEQLSMSRFSGPLPLSQSILVVLPHLLSLVAITAVCFAISYIAFMRQEIRSL